MMVGYEEIAQANCQMFFELLENDEQDEAKAALAHMMQTGEFEDVKCTILTSKIYGLDEKKIFWRLSKELTTASPTGNQPSPSSQPGAAVANSKSRYGSINKTKIINTAIFNDHSENIQYNCCKDAAFPPKTVKELERRMVGSLVTSPYYDKNTGNLTGQVPEILTKETRDAILEKFASSMNRNVDNELKKIEKKLYDKLRKTCNPNRVRNVASKGNTYSYPNSLYNVYMKTYSRLDSLNVGPPTNLVSEKENQVKTHAKDPGHECYLMWPTEENSETLKAVATGVVNCNGKEGECRCQSDHVRITVERLLSESDWVKLPTVSSETMDKTAFGEVPNLVRKENIMWHEDCLLSVAQVLASEKELKRIEQQKLLELKQHKKEEKAKRIREKSHQEKLARIQREEERQSRRQKANEQAQAKKQKTLQKSGLASQTIEIATKSQRKRKLSQKMRDTVTQ